MTAADFIPALLAHVEVARAFDHGSPADLARRIHEADEETIRFVESGDFPEFVKKATHASVQQRRQAA